MVSETESKLIEAIKAIADRVADGVKANDAMRFTQATLNAAHTIQVLRQVERIV